MRPTLSAFLLVLAGFNYMMPSLAASCLLLLVSWSYDDARLVLASFYAVFNLLLLVRACAPLICELPRASPALSTFLLSAVVCTFIFLSDGSHAEMFSPAEVELLYLINYGAFMITAIFTLSFPLKKLLHIGFFSMRALCLAVAAYSAIALYIYLNEFSAITFDWVNILWGFEHIRYWSHLATFSLPLLVTLAVLSNRTIYSWSWLWLARLAQGFLWWWMIATQARGSIISSLFALLFFCIVSTNRRIVCSKEVFSGLILGVLLLLTLGVLMPVIFDFSPVVRGLNTTSSGRLEQWYEAYLMVKQRPFLGWGPQGWLTHDTLSNAYHESTKYSHPHNMYLLISAEYGVFALLAFAIAIFCVFKTLIRSVLRDNQDVCSEGAIFSTTTSGFLACVLAMLVHSFFSAVLIVPLSSLLFALAFAYVCRLALGSAAFCVHGGRGTQALYKTGMVLLLTILCSTSTLYIKSILEYRTEMLFDKAVYLEEVNHRFWAPRFWQHGYFPRPRSEID